MPVSTTAPVKSATKAERGVAASSLGRSELHHTALVDDGHAIAELRRLREVVGNEQGGGVACAQHAAELARRRGARAGVER